MHAHHKSSSLTRQTVSKMLNINYIMSQWKQTTLENTSCRWQPCTFLTQTILTCMELGEKMQIIDKGDSNYSLFDLPLIYFSCETGVDCYSCFEPQSSAELMFKHDLAWAFDWQRIGSVYVLLICFKHNQESRHYRQVVLDSCSCLNLLTIWYKVS